VVIKYHLTKLNGFVQDAFSLDDNNIEKMMTSTEHRFETIYSPAHALSFSTDPMFAALYKRITGELKSSSCSWERVQITNNARLLYPVV
jgi:hypothetical protein